MIPTHCLLAAGFEQYIGLLIVLGIIVVKFVGQAMQASNRESEDGSAPSRPSTPSRSVPTSAEKVQAFLDQIARQASGQRPAHKQRSAAPPKPQVPPQARQVRKELSPVAAERVRDRVQREEQSKGRKLTPLEKRRIQSALEKRQVEASVAKPTKRSLVPAPEKSAKPEAQTDDPARRLDALLPSNALKRAIVLRDILGPCRAIEPLEFGRW